MDNSLQPALIPITGLPTKITDPEFDNVKAVSYALILFLRNAEHGRHPKIR